MNITDGFTDMNDIFKHIPDNEKYIVLKYAQEELSKDYQSYMQARAKQADVRWLVEHCDGDEHCESLENMASNAMNVYHSDSKNATILREKARKNFRDLYFRVMVKGVNDFENTYKTAIATINSSINQSTRNADVEHLFEKFVDSINYGIDLNSNEELSRKFKIYFNSYNDNLRLSVENDSPYKIKQIVIFDKKADKLRNLGVTGYVHPGSNMNLDYNLKYLSDDDRYYLIALDCFDDLNNKYHVVFRNDYLPLIADHIVTNTENVERMPGYSRFVSENYHPKNIHGNNQEQAKYISHTYNKLIVSSYEWSKTVIGDSQHEK